VADTARDLVYWYFPSNASATGAIDTQLVYNYRLDRWGKRTISIQTALQYSSGQITYDGLGSLYSTYDDLPEIPYDSPFWLVDSAIPGVFQGNTLYSLTGTPGASYLQTGDFGDLITYNMLKRCSPRYRVLPTAASATNFYRESFGSSPTQDQTIPYMRNGFDFRREALWHRLRLDFTGSMTINGLDIALERGGQR
jgi:hypothetical protein